MYHHCMLCPRRCGTDRSDSPGFCGCGDQMKAARAALHFWEEPCISGTKGSGAIFFSGCSLGCCFCQNHEISTGGFGKEISPFHLGEIMLKLQAEGAHNINLVTADSWLPSLLEALDNVRDQLLIPLVYNCSGYETSETIQALSQYIDIWLPDLKYYDSGLSSRYSNAPDYFKVASQAIPLMLKQQPRLVMDSQGILQKGVIVRHMILPGCRMDSIRLLHWMHDHLPIGAYNLSLLRQYTPAYLASRYPALNRRLTTFEYNSVLETAIDLGMTQGFMQEKNSAREEYTPSFHLEGLE